MVESLSSKWEGLSDHLIASFYEVKRDGTRVNPDVTVRAPLLAGSTVDITLNWQSPFENTGGNSLATLQQMLQSGTLLPAAQLIDKTMGTNLSSSLESLAGKTSITKLNSTQVFSGMPPVSIPVSLIFRAWDDPFKEVQEPFNQLMAWSLPVSLAGDSALARLADKGIDSTVVLPSTVPTLIAMQYKGATYAPLVIESISQPIDSPVDRNGRFIELTIPLKLATLTAIDRADFVSWYADKK